MRTVLRRVSTGTYFGGPDQWTPDPNAAVDFKMIDRALQFIDQWGLKDVEIAFAFRKGGVRVVPMDRVRVLFSER
jgi:hypothetical protein